MQQYIEGISLGYSGFLFYGPIYRPQLSLSLFDHKQTFVDVRVNKNDLCEIFVYSN